MDGDLIMLQYNSHMLNAKHCDDPKPRTGATEWSECMNSRSWDNDYKPYISADKFTHHIVCRNVLFHSKYLLECKIPMDAKYF